MAVFRFVSFITLKRDWWGIRLKFNSFFFLFFFSRLYYLCNWSRFLRDVKLIQRQMWEYTFVFCFPFQSLAPYLNRLHIHLLSLSLPFSAVIPKRHSATFNRILECPCTPFLRPFVPSIFSLPRTFAYIQIIIKLLLHILYSFQQYQKKKWIELNYIQNKWTNSTNRTMRWRLQRGINEWKRWYIGIKEGRA